MIVPEDSTIAKASDMEGKEIRVIQGYKLWKTNYMAYDWVNATTMYADHYDAADMEAFREYIAGQLKLVETTLDQAELQDILLHIYSNPVANKQKFV